MQILANALKALDSLREQAKGSKDATLKENISKLYDNVLDLKAAVLRVEQENNELMARIRDAENPALDPCPKCKRPGWQIKESHRDAMFGEVGGIRRVYECTLCGFTEEELVTPKARR